MRVRQFAWLLWIAGTVLIALSWVNAVSAQVGWIGFLVAMVGVVVSYIPQQEDRSLYPLTQEGFPVEPSGVPLPDDMPLEPGSSVLAFSQGKWWRATVIAAGEKEVLVNYLGWDPRWQEHVPRQRLQVDPDPSRMPLKLPPEGWLDRPAEQKNSEGVRTSGSCDGVQYREEGR